MHKLAAAIAITTLSGIGLAQAQTHTGHKHGASQQQPAAEEQPVPPDPVAMQKWFGQAVDDILTDADRAVGGQPAKSN